MLRMDGWGPKEFNSCDPIRIRTELDERLYADVSSCAEPLLLPTAAIAVIAPACPFCPAGHAFISLEASGGLICDYSAGRVA